MDIKPLGNPNAHYWKMTRMADAIGLSLVDQWNAGRLSTADHAGLIEKCRSCRQVEACGRLLAASAALDAPPAYCENDQMFSGMLEELNTAIEET